MKLLMRLMGAWKMKYPKLLNQITIVNGQLQIAIPILIRVIQKKNSTFLQLVVSEPSNLSSACNLLNKSLQSFIEDDKDLYLFHGDLTAKKLKGNNKNAIHIAK